MEVGPRIELQRSIEVEAPEPTQNANGDCPLVNPCPEADTATDNAVVSIVPLPEAITSDPDSVTVMMTDPWHQGATTAQDTASWARRADVFMKAVLNQLDG